MQEYGIGYLIIFGEVLNFFGFEGGVEVVPEEEKLVYNSVFPVGPSMSTGSFDVIVVNICIEESFMEIPVDFEEEVACSAIENDVNVTVFDSVDLVNCRMDGPSVKVLIFVSESFLHSPSVGERSDVETAAHASGISEDVGVSHGKKHCTMSTHTVSCNCAEFWIGDSRIVLVDIFDQFVGDKSFKLHCGVQRGVPVP